MSFAPPPQYEQMNPGTMGTMNGYVPGGPAMATQGGPPGMMTHGATGGGHEHHASIKQDTGESPRRCTDLGCCVFVLVMAITASTILINCHSHGNLQRLTHGIDYYGRTCGADPGVENKPFLYWCRELKPKVGSSVVLEADNLQTPESLDLDHPICVQYCPRSFDIPLNCIMRLESTNSSIPGGQFGNVETSIVQIRQSKVVTASYPTKPRGGRYCMPFERDGHLRDQILNTWGRALGPMSERRILVAIGTIKNVYWLFLCVGLLSTLMGYGYLYSIKFCAKYVVNIATALPMLWCLVNAGGFSFFFFPLIWKEESKYPDIISNFPWMNPLYKQYDDVYASIITGFFCFVFWFGFFFFLMLWFKFEGHVISDLIHAVFDVFRTDVGMYLQPLFEAITKFAVFWYGIQGLQIIASEGWLQKNNIEVNGARFAGLTRDYTPSLDDARFQILLLPIWIFIWAWSMEICTCFGQFVTSYEVFKYYSIPVKHKKKEKQQTFAIWEGIKYGWIYHFGSIAKGAFWIPLTRPTRLCYWVSSTLFSDRGLQHGQDSHKACPSCGECITKIMRCLCCALVCAEGGQNGQGTSCEKAVKSTDSANKDGFHDVVIRSNDWEGAVQKGHDLLEHSHPIVKNLYQRLDQMTVNVVGILSISSLNALMVYLFVSLLDVYKEPESTGYVADKMLVVFLAWVLSAYIAMGFMTLWDHSCDALLYCYAWSRKWKRETVENFIPESLRYIVGFDDVENDRYPYYGRAKNNMYLRSWLPMVGANEKHKGHSQTQPMRTGTNLPPPRSMEPQGSYMSGFGFGFGETARQQEAVSGDMMMGGGGEGSPLLGGH